MIKARKYRIYPTEEQKILLAKTFGCCRWVYNYFLELRNTLYEEEKKSISCYDMMSKLPSLKKENEWLKEVCASSLEQSLRHLDNAFTSFFKKRAGYPKFKKKANAQSFTEPGGVSIVDSKLVFPKFREGVHIIQHRPVEGKIKSATISKTASNQYYVSLVIDDGLEAPAKPAVSADTTIGIDLGLTKYATFSTGEEVENPRLLAHSLKELQQEQRKLSRMQRGSNNYEKQRIRVARAYQHLANQRANFLHNLTYKLTHENQVNTVCIEDLKIEDMLQNKQLSRCISDASWYEFRRLLEYKCNWYGKNLVIIPQYAPSSKLCQVCGHINNGITLADRVWTCPKCGTIHQRDLNAARNIRKIGLEQYYRQPK